MRRRKAEKREVSPDPIYGDVLLAKFINRLMYDGKKSLAQNIVYSSLERLAQATKEEPLEAFHKAINNVRPLIEVRSRRVGGATYQVPFEVEENRATSLAIRWIITTAQSKKGKSMVDKLSQELIDAYNNTGAAVKKREDVHKMAEANKAFAHYRW
ncbi:MAG: 30S ribosomal protein S7 [Defluviitoga tunisiensis]|jgi:small subunit ribosomal protein S7|uniref:Small ribosomal subunit protein uS7 n=1 Tax=Defluviitoga tunisiensis TaxID=1006576 RepID=A0A0C7P0C7_DEFTU|nr:30S ribosomal protein S7 [Defluviitoga tunisiensis]MDD3600691.1 30S ribosomal protein S7 [Defluviitoga tunisiensis]MDY0379089.1 30S ribosomal protein S7 [Defluviitoga tunisiensis]CEP77484.1 30S ribosomal protein S7 [Defluviitoga tunisiensis]HHV01279.1 30S ribosomal protein S7 [Defluviitoga tunisiensis]HOB55126.1 30S ribosomal protein S7 [Defluviitoga tunisiensis]